MDNEVDPVDPGGGNTKPPQKSRKIQISPAKKWVFTWNNYDSEYEKILVPKFQEIGVYGFQPEIGENETPHIQGWIESEKKIRPMSLKLPPQIHWEKMRGSVEESVEYCSKSETKNGEYVTNKKQKRALPKIELYGWQMMADAKLENEPDNREIFWIWSREGKRGKSSFVRHMVQERGAIMCAGKAADMKYFIMKYIEKNADYPPIVIFDVPRSMEEYLSYSGIEEIKNGVFASTKYESDMVVMPWPHVVVLANFEPELGNKLMSADRFTVWNVD